MRSPLLFLGLVGRSFPVPDDLMNDLAENAPQALLRDLHRPDKSFKVNPFDLVKAGFRSQHEQLTAAIKQTMFVDYRVHPQALLSTQPMIREDRAELRAILHSDWTKAPKLEVESKPLNPLELARFFGL